MPRPMRIKRITIAVPSLLFDLVSPWVSGLGASGVVFIGGVCGVGVVISGDDVRGVGAGVVILSGFGAGPIFEGAKGTMSVTVVPEDAGRSPTVQPVPVVSQ